MNTRLEDTQKRQWKGALFHGRVHPIRKPMPQSPAWPHPQDSVHRWLCFLGPGSKCHKNIRCFLLFSYLESLDHFLKSLYLTYLRYNTWMKGTFSIQNPKYYPLSIPTPGPRKATLMLLLLLLLLINITQEQNIIEFRRVHFVLKYLDFCHMLSKQTGTSIFRFCKTCVQLLG